MRAELDGVRRSPSNSLKASNGPSTPPTTKASLSNVLNGSLSNKSINNGNSSTCTNGTPVLKGDFKQPTFYGHDREEITRILIQGLSDLGYSSTAEALSRESGYDLETPFASAFRVAILQGEWAEAEALLLGNLSGGEGGVEVDSSAKSKEKLDFIVEQNSVDKTTIIDSLALSMDADRSEMLFLIRQQKYLELLEIRDLGAALMVLRQELQPLHQNERQLHALSSLIMCQSIEDLKNQATWDGAQGGSRGDLLSKLSKFISPSAMIPEHRLAELLHQVKQNQVLNCLYHNTVKWPSLYMDHVCEREDLPIDTAVEIGKHRDEVWYLQFSHDGSKLATASKDRTVLIYETSAWSLQHVLEHKNSVAYVSWSPDDTKLITCSTEARLWDTRLGTCMRTINVNSEPATMAEPISSAAWAPDGQSFVTGALCKKSTLCIWPTDSRPDVTPLHNFSSDCDRVRGCAIAAVSSPSSSLEAADAHPIAGKSNATSLIRLVAICVDKTINIFDYNRREKLSMISMDPSEALTSLSLSSDGHEMLVRLSTGEAWAMSIQDGTVKQKYRGNQHEEFIIKSCYGGAREGFVISGGEDAKISIWHRHSGRLLEQLEGHSSGCVNAVAWNMAIPGMFASAGDDAKVRIWMKAHPSTGATSLRSSEPTNEVETDDSQASSKAAPPQWGGASNSIGGEAGAAATGSANNGGAAPALMHR